jgi:hypothetical protein
MAQVTIGRAIKAPHIDSGVTNQYAIPCDASLSAADGYTVAISDAARRSVALKGTVARINAAFNVALKPGHTGALTCMRHDFNGFQLAASHVQGPIALSLGGVQWAI